MPNVRGTNSMYIISTGTLIILKNPKMCPYPNPNPNPNPTLDYLIRTKCVPSCDS